MDIFTNWIFWLIVGAIVVILAIIGYLTENKKKAEKNDDEVAKQPDPNNNQSEVQPVQQSVAVNVDTKTEDLKTAEPKVEVQTLPSDDWSIMPEVPKVKSEPIVKPLNAEVNVTPAQTVKPVETPQATQPVEQSTNTAVSQPENEPQVSADTTGAEDIWK